VPRGKQVKKRRPRGGGGERKFFVERRVLLRIFKNKKHGNETLDNRSVRFLLPPRIIYKVAKVRNPCTLIFLRKY